MAPRQLQIHPRKALCLYAVISPSVYDEVFVQYRYCSIGCQDFQGKFGQMRAYTRDYPDMEELVQPVQITARARAGLVLA